MKKSKTNKEIIKNPKIQKWLKRLAKLHGFKTSKDIKKDIERMEKILLVLDCRALFHKSYPLRRWTSKWYISLIYEKNKICKWRILSYI